MKPCQDQVGLTPARSELLMTHKWNQKGVPHKGWRCVDVMDLAADGPIDDSDYAVCEMCGNEKIRFVHVMEHNHHDEKHVGCVCAGKMTDDYKGAKEREKALRNKASRKARWLTRKWSTSSKGNPFLNVAGLNIVAFKRGAKWSFRIGDDFSTKRYDSCDQAKLAAFEELWLRNSN